MTDRIKQMAQQAGFHVDENGSINDGVETAADFSDELAKFAALVAEDCAQIADETTEHGAMDEHGETKEYATAEAIRARYPKPD